jgi:hypothetical protein
VFDYKLPPFLDPEGAFATYYVSSTNSIVQALTSTQTLRINPTQFSQVGVNTLKVVLTDTNAETAY